MRSKKIQLPNSHLLADVADLLDQGHRVTLRAKGDSMYPFIAGGRDSVVLQKAGAIRVGDIVLAHLPSGGYVLHRVYGRSGAAVRLMGDGNLYATESCRAEEVCGSVQEIIRRGKNVRCDGRGERFRVWLWMRLLPVRRYLLAVGKQWKKRGDRK